MANLISATLFHCPQKHLKTQFEACIEFDIIIFVHVYMYQNLYNTVYTNYYSSWKWKIMILSCVRCACYFLHRSIIFKQMPVSMIAFYYLSMCKYMDGWCMKKVLELISFLKKNRSKEYIKKIPSPRTTLFLVCVSKLPTDFPMKKWLDFISSLKFHQQDWTIEIFY